MDKDFFNLIDFDPYVIEESEKMEILEYEKEIKEKNSNNYISNDTKYNDPVGYIDDDYKPDDIQSYNQVKDQYLNDKTFFNNILFYAKEEYPNAFCILKYFKPVFLKRLGIEQ